jgi:hypothetical protein
MSIANRNLSYKDKRGISLVISVLIGFTSILIGFAVANLALKETILSGSVKDSEIAFYAANSGIECGLFEDLRNVSFDPEDKSPLNLTCNGQIVPIISNGINPGDDPFCIGDFDDRGQQHLHQGCWVLTTDAISLEEGDINSPCFSLRVIKEKFETDDGLGGLFTYFATALESRGHNTCNTNAPRRLERAIRALY